MLKLRIVSDHRASLGGNAEKTLYGGDLTVGRGGENGWILPDPDLLLSRQHCIFEEAGSGYRVIDTSTNGVFLNGSDQPLGRNVPAPLKSGDRIRVGRFIIEAVVESPGAPSFTEITGSFALGGRTAGSDLGGSDLFAPSPSREAAAPDQFDELFDGPASRPFEDLPLRADREPFDAWTASSSGSAARERADDWRFGAVDDHSDPLNQALSIGVSFSAPAPSLAEPPRQAVGGIPDDWDDELFGTPQPASPAIPSPAAPIPPASFAPQPTAQPSAAQPLPDDWNIDETLPDPGVTEPPVERPSAILPAMPPAVAPLPVEPSYAAFQQPVRPIDHVPLPDDSVIAPRPVSVATLPPVPAPVPPMPVSAPAAPPFAAPVTAPAPDAGAAVAAFYEGFGAALPPDGLPDPTAMMRSLGEALRVSLGALHGSLRARSRFKDEFHLEQTSFRPSGENPLKRCETLDEAVSVLANPRLRGFLPMADAVREAADDVQVHHLAYAAALQTALKQVVAKFDPGALSQRLETRLLDSIVPGARKARYWDQYEALYKDLVVELEEDFDRVVGDAIAREYDRFVRRDAGDGPDGQKPD
ncbi:type VI secretion system-associated FHA domain protein TagH [Azospirillum sp. YIM B02556]|uniref:Type VI secretion system-associated FHA domain protein TagH n=1 Tax=Azospirillum endophyticum TaxID=2800326 RepID=A0ABS1F6J0_9PROT|nr:type VI secretion system-associated FHA domain protein TagH [Azospirillum endophyticum]MBK1839036.1 type VI secretion system-associated FHA domain protein TagH [Azospirillum endophyticum]